MRMRLIDADALDMYERLKSYYGDAWRDAQEEIDNAPTVDAVPVKHGHWLVNMFFIECSECGETFPLEPQNYCPNCGARMDEAKEE